MIAGNDKVNMFSVLTDESPSDKSEADIGGGTVDSLNRAEGAGGISDKIRTIGSNGENASCVKDDLEQIRR